MQNKVAIVTGAGRGIGRAITLRFASEGAKILVNDVDIQKVKEVVQEINKSGGVAEPDQNTVVTIAGGKAIVEKAVSYFGSVDMVATAAAVVNSHMIFNMTEDDWDSVIEVGLKGTFTVVRHACEVFRRQKSGRIITFTSEAGILGGGIGQANYAATKAGIIGFTKAIAYDMQKYNVTANCISPRALTRLSKGLEQPRTGMANINVPVLIEPDRSYADMYPDDVAKFATFLASESSQKISSKVFLVYANVIGLVTTDKLSSVAWKPGKWTVEELIKFVPEALMRMPT